MKRRTHYLASFVLTVLVVSAPLFCPAQIIENSASLNTLPATNLAIVEVELEEVSTQIDYLERVLFIYSIYGIEGSAKDNVEVNLEEAEQKQSQLLQLLSNVSKTMSDVSTAIVRNLR